MRFRKTKAVMMLGGFYLGEAVNYHSLIGGVVTSSNHRISHLLPEADGNFEYDVAWITNKSGCVIMTALSHKGESFQAYRARIGK